MRQYMLLILLLLCARTALGFDTTPDPDKHWLYITVVLDDRADSQVVNVCNEFDIPLTIAPYQSAATQIIDYDSTDFNGNGTAAKGEYNDWLIGWAAEQGATFADHDQPQAPLTVATSGRNAMYNRWDTQNAWLKQQISRVQTPEVDGFVWVGHVNSPEVRAMAKVQGYNWTRGALANSKDLYLGNHGWESESGALPFLPPCMLHKSLVPSFSLYRLNSSGAVPQDTTAAGVPAVSDSAGWWDGVWTAFDQARRGNQFWVLNPHPGWGVPWAETESDTIATTWCHTPDGDSLRFATRRGVYSRNDVSPFQLSFILKRLKVIDDSLFAADGVRRICVVEMNSFMRDNAANWRTDDSSNPDAVSDWNPSISSGLDNPYWQSNTGLYARDPELNINKTIYVDGSGTRTAGNGTQAFPLPASALPSLFNCKVKFVGHAVGDTLVLQRPLWMTGNVDVDFAGLTITPASVNTSAFLIDSTGANVYLHNVTLRNFTLDGMATTATTPVFYVGSGTGVVDSLRTTDFTIKGATFINAEDPLYIYNAKRAVVDSCFFLPGQGAITNNGITWALQTGAYCAGGVIRNSVFNMDDCGGGTGDAAGSGVSGAIQMAGHAPDSLRIIDNVFILGNTADTDDYQAVLRTPAVNASLTARLSGNYIATSGVGTNASKVWLFTTGYSAGTLAQLADTMALYSSGAFVPTKNFLNTGYAIGAYSYLTNVSDTLRYGGYAGVGSAQYGNTTASIGPKLYTVAPQISSYYTNSEYYGWTTPREYFQDLIETGILASGWTVGLQMQTVADRIYAEQWFGTDIHAGHLDSLVVQLSDTRRTYTDYSTSFYGYPGPREYFVAEIETGNEGVGTVLDFKVDSEYWRVLADQWFGTDLNAGHLDSLVVRLIN